MITPVNITANEAIKAKILSKEKGTFTSAKISRRPSGLRKTRPDNNSLAHKTTWLGNDVGKAGFIEMLLGVDTPTSGHFRFNYK